MFFFGGHRLPLTMVNLSLCWFDPVSGLDSRQYSASVVCGDQNGPERDSSQYRICTCPKSAHLSTVASQKPFKMALGAYP